MSFVVDQLWRQAVKSMRGERLEALEFAAAGAADDRARALRDGARGGIRGGKKNPAIMRCAARSADETPTAGAFRPAEITLPDSSVDVRRFRPDLVVAKADAEGFVEGTRVERTLRAGEVEFACEASCPHCAMATHGFADLPRDTRVMRLLVRENGSDLDACTRVTRPDVVHRGDTVSIF
ncbi:MAG: hypothetical protein V2J24_06370 [Pseudomonadales bacterium]|jgi:uncharacterized protein YcbX|nr:hypothetical protein [Pseudomonadales bacterium]